MKPFIKICRPHEYIKNIFILLPLFFAGEFFITEKLTYGLLSFLSFSLSASAIYIFNDFCDLKNDRKHPKKKYRPLAIGSVSKNGAFFLMIILLLIGLILMYFVSTISLTFLIIYISLNLLYSLKLKQFALLDVTIISIGFIIRLFIGSFACNISLTPWIVIMTFLLSLFLALAKRRDDIFILKKTGVKARKSILGYNLEFINGAMLIMSAVIIVSYLQFTISSEMIIKFGSEYLYLTVIFVIFGIIRYLQIQLVEKNYSSPTEIILTDKILQINVFLWIVSFIIIIY